ncbi:WD40 repeat-like protein [Sesbania bispinosa]|nr:WD40 repeat-like protein [Sesbania bispinosa]
MRADGVGDVSRGDPLAVGGVAGDGDGVGMLAVDEDLEGIVEDADEDESGGAVENVVGFGIARDEDVAATLSGGNTGVGL